MKYIYETMGITQERERFLITMLSTLVQQQKQVGDILNEFHKSKNLTSREKMYLSFCAGAILEKKYKEEN